MLLLVALAHGLKLLEESELASEAHGTRLELALDVRHDEVDGGLVVVSRHDLV